MNTIPCKNLVLTGTVRTLDDDAQALAERRLREIVAATAATFGATAELTYTRGYPALINHPDMVELAREVATRALGAERVGDTHPVMGGEDFAYYLQKIPGTFIFLGTDSKPYPHHRGLFLG